MLTIIETLWRLVVLTGCAFIQVFAAIFGAITVVFGTACEFLRKISGRMLRKLDNGKCEYKMRRIATKEV